MAVSKAYQKRINSYVNRYFPEYRGARLPAEVRRAANGAPSTNPRTEAGAKALAIKALSDPRWGDAVTNNSRASEALAKLLVEQPNIADSALASAKRSKREGTVTVTENYSGVGPVAFEVGVGGAGPTTPSSRRSTQGSLAELMRKYKDVPVPVFFTLVDGEWEVEVADNTP